MSLLDRYKQQASLKKIQQLASEKPYKHDFVDIEKAKSVGIIVNMTTSSKDEHNQLLAYIKNLLKVGKNVQVIEINFDKKADPFFNTEVPSIFINGTKLSWLLDYPNSSIEAQIRRHDFDILLNFDTSDRMTSKYVCGMAKVKTRAGIHVEGLESCYELMVNSAPNKKVPEMIREYEHFLQMIEK